MSPLSKFTNLEHTSHLELVKNPNSKRVNDLFINKTIPVTLCNNLLTVLDTNKDIKLQGNLSKMITSKNYNVDLAILADKKSLYELAREM